MSWWLPMLAYPHGRPWSLHHLALWGHWGKTSRWVCTPQLPIYGKVGAASSSSQKKCAISARTSAGHADDVLLGTAGVTQRHSKRACEPHTWGNRLTCPKGERHCGCRGEHGEETGYYLLHESPSLPLWRSSSLTGCVFYKTSHELQRDQTLRVRVTIVFHTLAWPRH